MLITIPGALVFGVLGIRRARGTGRGVVRCWLGIVLALSWAGLAAFLAPQLARAADPGCAAYKNSALTAYQRFAADVNSGASRAVLAHDLAVAIRQVNGAAAASHRPTAARSLTGLSAAMRTANADVRAGVPVPGQVMRTLNRDSASADRSCGTIHL